MKVTKPVLILGFFVDNNAQKQNIRSAEDRMAAMFRNYGVQVIISSSKLSKNSRLLDTIITAISRRNDYDIAIVPLFGTWPSFLWQEAVTRILKLLKKKIVLGIHGGSIPERINNGAQRFYKAAKRADILFAPSGYFKTIFEEKNIKVRVIENPVDMSMSKFYPKNKITPKILWMRAFTDIYNPFMAVRVAQKLAHKYPDFEMTMAGKDGNLLSLVKEMAFACGLGDKIKFPGYINMQQKHQLAQQCDIYICTNKIDNAPVSLIEFMRFGLPVVSVNSGGIPYMITNEQNGLLVDSDNDDAMVEKIDMLISNASFAQSIIANAYNYTHQFDEPNVMEKWKIVFQELSNV